MANLNIKMNQNIKTCQTEVIVTFTNDIPQADIVDLLNNFFEIEMYSHKQVINSNNTIISLFTDNKEKVEILRKNMIKAFRHGSNLNQINNN